MYEHITVLLVRLVQLVLLVMLLQPFLFIEILLPFKPIELIKLIRPIKRFVKTSPSDEGSGRLRFLLSWKD